MTHWTLFFLVLMFLSPPVWAIEWSEDTVFNDDFGYRPIPADMDGDGDLDLTSIHAIDDVLLWYENPNGMGQPWITHTIDGSYEGVLSFVVVDVDGDEHLDVVASTQISTTRWDLVWWENQNDVGTSWTRHAIISTRTDLVDLVAHDMDGDGVQDLIVSRSSEPLKSGLVWLENDVGTGLHWTEHSIDARTVGPNRIAVLDMDDDDDLDLVGNPFIYGGTIAWWENLDGASRTWEIHEVAGNADFQAEAYGVFPTDIDADGAPDLISVKQETEGFSLEWRENVNGDASEWIVHLIADVTISNRELFSADVDGDGYPDILTSDEQLDGIVSWWKNPADVDLPWTNDPIGELEYLHYVSAADMDGDGYLDLVAVTNSDGVRIWENLFPFSFLEPASFQAWQIGLSYEISWVSSIDALATLELVYDDEVVAIVATDFPCIAGEESTLEWRVPPLPIAGGYRVRIRAEYDGQSHQVETEDIIQLTSPISLLSHNAGAPLELGGTTEILWDSSLDSTIRLELFRDASPVGVLGEDLFDDGFWEWILAGYPAGSGYSIQVSTTAEGHTYSDESNAPFDLVLPGIELQLVASDTAAPSFVNLLFRASTQSGTGVSFLDDLAFYQVLENGNEVSPTESIPSIGKLGTAPFIQKTVLMLDNSFSIGLNLELVKEAARTAIRQKFAEQEIEVWTFSENVVQVQPFSRDGTVLLAAVDSIRLGPPSTDLYGAVVAGTAQLQNSFSHLGIVQSTLVLMTDGRDTQGSTSEADALAAVVNQQVFTVAVGDVTDTAILVQLGTAGSSNGDFEDLPELFSEVQRLIEEYANSFYWLTYISPSRNNPNVTLQLSVQGNPITSNIGTTFTSVGFSSVSPGIYLNRDFNALLGLDQIVFAGSDNQVVVEAESLFQLYEPSFRWTVADPGRISIVDVWGDSNALAHLVVLSDSKFSTTLTVEDLANGIQRVIPIHSDATVPEPSAGLLQFATLAALTALARRRK